jgi:hypothetical protein
MTSPSTSRNAVVIEESLEKLELCGNLVFDAMKFGAD